MSVESGIRRAAAAKAAGAAAVPQKRPGWRKRWLVGISLVMVAALVAAYYGARPLLFVEGGNRHADVIVVLGGDPGNRVFRALELYKGGAAPKIIISGDGDCEIIRDRFVLAGVTSNALILEPNSRNTKENAEFSIRMMKEQGISSAIVVTSWYHSRRALACFRKFGPDMQFSSYPTYDGPDMEHKPGSYELPHVVHEYPALAWYLVRYGVAPYCKLSAEAIAGK